MDTLSLFGRTKPYSRGQSSDDISRDERGGQGGGRKENEYLVEPKALNELEAKRSMEQESDGMGSDWPHHPTRISPLRSDITSTTRTAMYNPGRSLSAPQSTNSQAHETRTRTLPSTTSTASTRKYDSTVRFSVPPTASTSAPSTHLHPSPPSHFHSYPLTTSTASPSNPNDIGGLSHPRLTTAHTSYSNSTAVFGPPVKFGEHAREMPSRQPTLVRHAEVQCTYARRLSKIV